ncbi:MAG: ATP synthase F1 subunit delta [Planctomycetales bacterium]|nr:ATP synthase F1 subunit delta [Planctomycetales bacterium]
MAADTAAHESFDTDRQQLGKIYAKALLGAAGADGEKVLEELDSLLDDVLKQLPNLSAMLQSPRVPHGDKEAMLDKAFRGKMTPILLNFLKVCSKRRRLDCLGAVRAEARRLYNELNGRVEVRVTTAAPLQPERLQSLQGQLSRMLGAEVVMLTEVDPELLGGLVVRVGDTVYDGSIANRLDRFRQSALTNAANTVRSSMQRFTS